MGGAGSTSAHALRGTDEELMALCQPKCYKDHAIMTDSFVQLARKSWKLILSDQSPEFIRRKQDPAFQFETCIQWFHETFYGTLFQRNPSCRSLYICDMRSQGRALVGSISFTLSQLWIQDMQAFYHNMEQLAIAHSKVGVRAVEFGIFGDIMVETMALCLGSGWSKDVEEAWINIYSAMVKVIIPKCIQYERVNHSTTKVDTEESREILHQISRLFPHSDFGVSVVDQLRDVK